MNQFASMLENDGHNWTIQFDISLNNLDLHWRLQEHQKSNTSALSHSQRSQPIQSKFGMPLKHLIFLSYLSRSVADRWGTTVDFTTRFLHSSQFLGFRSMIFHSRPVHSLMLSSHCFFCLPLCLPPWTVPCRIVLASPDDHVTCLYHFSLCLFIGYVISVWDTKEVAETSHLQCLYPSFNVCCYGPRFTYIQKYVHGLGTHQSDLGADGDVLVVPDDF